MSASVKIAFSKNFPFKNEKNTFKKFLMKVIQEDWHQYNFTLAERESCKRFLCEPIATRIVKLCSVYIVISLKGKHIFFFCKNLYVYDIWVRSIRVSDSVKID